MKNLFTTLPQRAFAHPFVEYAAMALLLWIATGLSQGAGDFPMMAILRPLVDDRSSGLVLAWQAGYIGYTVLMAIAIVRSANLFGRIKDPRKLRGLPGTLFVLMAWIVTGFVHHYEPHSGVDQLLLFPPATAAMLWVQSRITSQWLASLLHPLTKPKAV